MYDFVDVINGFDRMCNQLQFHCDVNECPIAKLIDDWEMAHEDVWESNCLSFARENPEEFEDVVYEWIKAHPLPFYPTIGEVVNKMSELMGIDDYCNLYELLEKRLTPEAATYFNIKPINEGQSNN